jgi:hypothetical protein
LVHLKEGSSLLDETGLAQAVRQSVWNHALAGQSDAELWPWEDRSVSMSLAPMADVPRLGLSAALLKLDRAGAPNSALAHTRRAANADTDVAAQDDATLGDVALGDVALGDVANGVAIGDSITFTAANGATCVYTITGRRVVDPHLANNEAERTAEGTSPLNCGPLDAFILDATQGETPKAPPAADQQKL